jgi:hypothetical protein
MNDDTVVRNRTLERLHDLGVHIFPVDPGAALGSDISNTGKIAREDLEATFSGVNVAAAWGVKSGGVINVAVHVEEAQRVAASLPETGMVFGPESALDTNHVYFLDDRVKELIVFRDTTVVGGAILAELRGEGTCNLVPPSKTLDGKDIRFSKFDGPARVQLHDLLGETSRIAAAALIARHARTDEPEQVGMGLRRYLRELGVNKKKTLHVCRLVADAVGGDVGEQIFAQAEANESTPIDGGHQLARCLGGRDVVDLFKMFLVMGYASPTAEPVGLGSTRRKQVDDVLQLAEDFELFNTPEGDAYASFRVWEHEENYPIIRDGTLGRILQARFYESFGTAAAPSTINTALDTLKAMAFLDKAPCISVYTRIAGDGEKVYVDLTNEKWEVVEIDREGWRLLKRSPVKFRRSPTALPLPVPAPGGTVDELRALLNVDDDAWRAILGFTVGCYNPRGPYFVLPLHGEQGSAKTTAAGIIKNTVDPQVPATRCLPRDERDLAIAAKNAHVLSFDNLSRLSYRLSDAICRLSTGGGLATRTLYTDDGETVFDMKRPVILNGIEDFTTRGDLLDRSLVAYLKNIPDGDRLSEEELDAKFLEAHPRILGGLCDAVSVAIRNKAGVNPKTLPRMADAAKFVMAAESALGWADGSFIAGMMEDRQYIRELELEAVALAYYIVIFMNPWEKTMWSGTATFLYQELHRLFGGREDLYFDRDVPRDPVKIGNQLRRIAPALREKGLEVITGKRVGKLRTRTIEINKFDGSKTKWASSVSPASGTSVTASAPATTGEGATHPEDATTVTPGNPIATTTAIVTETVMSPVVPPVPDDLELPEEVKKKRRTRAA